MPYEPEILDDLHRKARVHSIIEAGRYIKSRRQEFEAYDTAVKAYEKYRQELAEYERQVAISDLWNKLDLRLPTDPKRLVATQLWKEGLAGFFAPLLLANPERLLRRAEKLERRVERQEDDLVYLSDWRRRALFSKGLTYVFLGRSLPAYRLARYHETFGHYREVRAQLRSLVSMRFLLLPHGDVADILTKWIHWHVGNQAAALLALYDVKKWSEVSRPEDLLSLRHQLFSIVSQVAAEAKGRAAAQLPSSERAAALRARNEAKDWHQLEKLAPSEGHARDLAVRPRPFVKDQERAHTADEREGAAPLVLPEFPDAAEMLVTRLNQLLEDKAAILRAFAPQLQWPPEPVPPKPAELACPTPPRERGHWADRPRGWEDWEWETHYSILGLDSGPHPGKNLLVGYSPSTGSPLLVDRGVLEGHAYILGGTRRGKTSSGLTPLLIQILRGTDEPNSSDGSAPPPPVLVIDFKGDMALFHTARIEAKERGQRFSYFALHSQKDSFVFDPLRDLSPLLPDSGELVETVLQALGLIHSDEYGPGFYTDTHINYLGKAVQDLKDKGREVSWQSIVTTLKRLDKRSNRDASHVLSSIEPMLRPPLATRLSHELELSDPRVISMSRLIENREVAYFWLPSHRMKRGSRTVAKLAVSAYVHSADARADAGQPRRCYCMVDEFQHLVSQSIGEVFQTASKGKVSLIVANQSIQDLKQIRQDLSHILRENTAYKQWFSVQNREDIQYINDLSGEEVILLSAFTEARSRVVGEAFSDTTGYSHASTSGSASSWAQSWGSSTGHIYQIASDGREVGGQTWTSMVGGNFGGSTQQSYTSGGSHAHGRTSSTAEGEMKSVTQAQHIRPRVTSEDIRQITHNPLGSIVHIAVDKGLGTTGGIPIALQGLFTMSQEEHAARDAGQWPPAAPNQGEAQSGGEAPIQSELEFESSDLDLRKARTAEMGLKLQALFDREAALN